MTVHVTGRHHREAFKAASSSQSLTSFFCPQLQHSITVAEIRWALFIAKHNLSFACSDHATKLFKSMLPDSEIAKSFRCGHTKIAAIIKEVLSPFFHQKMLENLKNPFSILLDESNDKVDKSCIIIVRYLDLEIGNVSTKFLDMPVVNIGSAQNIFRALKESLQQHGLHFSKAVAFLSDTANVMKGCRSGVQKLIKTENPQLYDIGYICHLVDLAVKAGMEQLPIEIDSLSTYFIIFITVVSDIKSFQITGALFSLQSQRLF